MGTQNTNRTFGARPIVEHAHAFKTFIPFIFLGSRACRECVVLCCVRLCCAVRDGVLLFRHVESERPARISASVWLCVFAGVGGCACSCFKWGEIDFGSGGALKIYKPTEGERERPRGRREYECKRRSVHIYVSAEQKQLAFVAAAR